ncbi:MAG: DUF523 and DUF1722 domain-containing protein [Planctomycetota bacterium]
MATSDCSNEKIRVGISYCLLGEKCRWNGDHKRDYYITDTVGKFVEFVPCCPETEIGLGIPRETLRLVKAEGETRLVTSRSGVDHTQKMYDYSVKMVEKYTEADICGYILKKDSPSCGMERVKIYDSNGVPAKTGVGIFAAVLKCRFPLLPIEEEGRLHDPRLRENFFERLFAYHRLKKLFAGNWSLGDLVAFHTSEKFLLLAHDPNSYRELGRIVAAAKGIQRNELEEKYFKVFMTAMSKHATVGKHLNVLNHMVGYLREHLGDQARADLQRVLDDYAARLIPLVVPLTLIAHYVRVCGIEYLKGQYYLEPHPKELMIRNYT